MKTLHLLIRTGTALSLATLACGAVMAQTPGNGNPTQPVPQTAGPGPAGTPGSGAAAAPGSATPGSAAPEASSHMGSGIYGNGSSAAPSGAAPGMEHGSHQSTQSFITKAAHANQAEIDEARYALDHTSDDQVKNFAQRMLDDHTKALDQLKQIASTDSYDVPSGISTKDRMEMSRLKRDSGARFDAAYSREEVRDHRSVIADFKQAEQNASLDPAVRRYARDSLGTLTEHLHMAEHLVATAGKGNRSAG